MIMPDKMREECFRTAVFMNKFNKGKAQRRVMLKEAYEKNPESVDTAYTYGAFCFLYGEKGNSLEEMDADLLEQMEAILDAQKVFKTLVAQDRNEWLARYFCIRLDMHATDEYRDDKDIFEEVAELENDEKDTDDVVYKQMTKILKAEVLFNMKRYDESLKLLKEIQDNPHKVVRIKNIFFDQVFTLYKKMVVCQRTDFSDAVKDILDKLFKS